MTTILVNGAKREVQAPADTPLLYVLRNDLELSGPQFGCGLAQCGACSVLLNGKEVRSCITPLSAAAGKEVTTLEGSPCAMGSNRKGSRPKQAAQTLHPVQEAWIAEQTPLCGFCQNGMMIKATELLERSAVSDRGADQGSIYLRRFSASLPLRKLYGDHPGCSTRRYRDDERSEIMIARQRRFSGNNRRCLRSRAFAPRVCESRRRTAGRLRSGHSRRDGSRCSAPETAIR